MLNARAVADDLVCWTRMQAEAGQRLDAIVRRKELERRAGEGLFAWGVGNAPSRMIGGHARSGAEIRTVFSIMRSRPRAVDADPRGILLWRRYLDERGVERRLPENILVTSGAGDADRPKRAHYALLCRSEHTLALGRSPSAFDPSAHRNAGVSGRPVGASQVTALLRRVAPDGPAPGYAVDMEARLTGACWVRLTDPVPVARARVDALDEVADVDRWLEAVYELRSAPRPQEAATSRQLHLL